MNAKNKPFMIGNYSMIIKKKSNKSLFYRFLFKKLIKKAKY